MNPLLPKDINLKILSQLDDESLVAACSTNHFARDFCNTHQGFWRDRIHHKLGIPYRVMNKYNPFPLDDPMRWSRYYIEELSKINEQNAIEHFWSSPENGRLDIMMAVVNTNPEKIQNFIYDMGLVTACQHGHFEMVRYLIENTGFEFSPLYYNEAIRRALKYGHSDIAQYLSSRQNN